MANPITQAGLLDTMRSFLTPQPFDSGEIAVADAANWVLVSTITAAGRPVALSGTVGAGGALGGLRLTRTMHADGAEVDLLIDADLSAGTEVIPDCTPNNPHLTAAAGSFALSVISRAQVLRVYAKKFDTDTTLRVRGQVL